MQTSTSFWLVSKKEVISLLAALLNTVIPIWLHGFFYVQKEWQTPKEGEEAYLILCETMEGRWRRKRTLFLLLQMKQKSDLSCRIILLMFFLQQCLNSMAFLCWEAVTSRFCLANWKNAVLKNDHLTSSTIHIESQTWGRSLLNIAASRVRS